MNTVLNVKIDTNLKRQAQETAKTIGLPISTVVAAGLREFVRNRSITLSDNPLLKPEVEKELLRRSQDAHAGKHISPAFGSLAAAREWIDSSV